MSFHFIIKISNPLYLRILPQHPSPLAGEGAAVRSGALRAAKPGGRIRYGVPGITRNYAGELV